MVMVFDVTLGKVSMIVPVALGNPERRLKYKSAPELLRLILEIVAGEIRLVI